MKILKYCIPLASAITFAGCSDDLGISSEISGDRIPLTVRGTYPSSTRASDNGFDNGDKIGLFVLDRVDGVAEDISGSPHASNVRFDFDGATNTFKGVTDLYWTGQSTPSDLIAYYPFHSEIESVREMAVSVDRRQDTDGQNGDPGGYEASDFLYAKVEKAMPSSEAVNLTFSHAFAGITVTLMPGDGFEDGEWSGLEKMVTVNNVVTTATIDLLDGKVTPDVAATSSVTPLRYGNDFRGVIIPQSISAGTEILSISVDGKGYGFTKDSDMTFVQGKMHTFTITVNRDSDGSLSFELTTIGIIPWLDTADFRDGLTKQYVIVDVPEVGKLAEAISAKGLEPKRITNLKLTGNLNEKDFEYIRGNIQTLKALNLYETRVECFVDSGMQRMGIEKDYFPEDGLKNMSTLTHVVLPRAIKVIGPLAFCNSGIMGDLIIPDGTVEICRWAFGDCKSLLSVTLPASLRKINESAFVNSTISGELVLPSHLEEIGEGAFAGTRLTGELNLPESISKIGVAAFSGVNFTGSLVFPQGIKEVPERCFSNFTGTLTIPEGVEVIGHEAFNGCGFKGELVLPSTLRRIDSRAFNGNRFSKVIFPENLKDLGEAAFSNCANLSGTLEIPEGFTTIPTDAFRGCSLLSEIVLPKNLVRISSGAFSNCYNLSSIISHAETPPLLRTGYDEDNIGRPVHVFDGVPKDNFTVQVPASAVEEYRQAGEWKEFKRIAAYSNFVCRPASVCALKTMHTQEGVILNADGAWKVTHQPDWIVISKTQGDGKTELSVTFKALGENEPDREDYIEFTLNGDDNVTTRCSLSQRNYKYGEDECLTLQTHTKGNGIDIVFAGDGFDAEAIASGEYLELVKTQMEDFFGIEPYTTYRDYFNVKVCFPLSQETGVNTANTWRDTKFGTYYSLPSTCSAGGLELFDPDAVFDYVAKTAGITDMSRSLVVLTLNSDAYGSNSVITGNGSAIAIVGKSPDPYPMDSRGIMQREAGGIAFGKLASERATSVMYLTKNERQTISSMNQRGWYMNLTLSGGVNDVWWKDFIFNPDYSERVDVFEGGFGKTRGCFRSEINSCMNFGIPYFSLAARYDIVKRIKQYAGEEFTLSEFLSLDSDRWGQTRSGKGAADFGSPVVSFKNETKFIKSKKY